jgi:hypothetical protein
MKCRCVKFNVEEMTATLRDVAEAGKFPQMQIFEL